FYVTGVGVEGAAGDVQLHKEPAQGSGGFERPAVGAALHHRRRQPRGRHYQELAHVT
ncbi:unnamed protein product, partial [Linum tenue]